MELEGRLVDASNTTLRAFVTLDGVTARCVYKPVRGERPLWDFPDGTLAGREVAAYLVSEATGWDVVPPTVLRTGRSARAPASCGWTSRTTPRRGGLRPGRRAARRAGCGSPRRATTTATRTCWPTPTTPALARMALFDAVVNNADRKGGHVLHIGDGQPATGSTTGCASTSRTSCARCCGAGSAAGSRDDDLETLGALEA